MPSVDEWQLCSLSFDDFSLDRDEMVMAALRMFLDLGLVSRFKIDYGVRRRKFFEVGVSSGSGGIQYVLPLLPLRLVSYLSSSFQFTHSFPHTIIREFPNSQLFLFSPTVSLRSITFRLSLN